MKTLVADMIEPDVWNKYVIERTAQKNRLIQSGAVSTDSEIQAQVDAGGRLINMPFFKDLSGADEILSDTTPLTPDGIHTEKDQAVMLRRGKAWSVNDLAKHLSGADPFGTIADLVASYFARREQDALISSLAGYFADNIANDAADHVHDIAVEDEALVTAATKISGSAVLRTANKIGDDMESIAIMIMHSFVYAGLLENDQIQFRPDSEGSLTIPMFKGIDVISDDSMPSVPGSTSGDKYDVFMFGAGALGRAEKDLGGEQAEIDRDILAGDWVLTGRRHYIYHARGVKFTDASVAALSPTNAELALATNWDRVYEPKNVKVVKLVVNG